jgi:threonine synthase
MGEGSTPLAEYGGAALKLEYLNPTGSFKDRGAALSVRLAAELGYRCVSVDSSGNTAIAVAAYAGRLGLEARVYVPRGAGAGKRALLRALGARVVEAPDRDAAAALAERGSGGCFYVA